MDARLVVNVEAEIVAEVDGQVCVAVMCEVDGKRESVGVMNLALEDLDL